MPFRSPPLSAERGEFAKSLQRTQQLIAQLQRGQVPHAVPPKEAGVHWTMLVQAELEAIHDRVMNQPINPATVALTSMLDAYARGNVATFNKQLTDYRKHLSKYETKIAENPAAFSRCFRRVLQQVGQNAFQQILVRHYRRRAFRQAAIVRHFGMRRLQEGDAFL